MATQILKTMLLSYTKKHENVSRIRPVFFLFALRYLLHTWWINFLFFTLESSLSGWKIVLFFRFRIFYSSCNATLKILHIFICSGLILCPKAFPRGLADGRDRGGMRCMLWEHIADLGCEAHRLKWRFQSCEGSWIDRVYIWRQGCGDPLILSFYW